MNKEQQIEEMAKFMHYKAYGKDCENVKCELCWCPSKNDAEAFYNEGYRKLSEDSAVLSREKYEAYKKLAEAIYEEGHLTTTTM